MTTPAADLLNSALDASAEAAFASLAALESDRGDCGGAWVVLPQGKGRKALLDVLKARGFHVERHHAGGMAVKILKNLRCQSRAPWERGCRAFADTLKAAGIAAHVYSYAD